MESLSLLSLLTLGLLIGLKHALEADHVAAVAAIASERRNLLSSTMVGAWWGLGHTVALLAAAVLVIVLRVQISDNVAAGLELGVAAMLVGLGVDSLRKLARSRQIHLHVHQHGEHVHVHPHVHDRVDAHGDSAAGDAHHGVPGQARPFFVGVVHGLAGSAALMLLVASAIPSPALAFAYVAAFGIGSIGGMIAMSVLVGVPAALTARRYNRANVLLRTVAGAASICFGLALAWQIVT
jgi:ABC-type nickel/cobalt efflux system permease component RcnA